ncbi:MAG: hypothetical protein V2I47_09220 [Bacteroidales bacterium]|jgi:hypothetical protein|nr:hypothetical protein [Bacteroidales bacterium]
MNRRIILLVIALVVGTSSMSQGIDNESNRCKISIADQVIKESENNETVGVTVFKDTVMAIPPNCINFIISPKAHSIGFVECVDGTCEIKVYDTLGRLVKTHSNLPHYFTSNMLLFESGYFSYIGPKRKPIRSLNDTIKLFVYNDRGELVFQNEPWGMRSFCWYPMPPASTYIFSGSIIGTDPIRYQLVLLQDSEEETIVLSKILDPYPDPKIWLYSTVNSKYGLISVYYYNDPDYNIDSLFFKYTSSSILELGID